MIKISLPDGKIKNFDRSLSAFDVARDISPSLAKKAVCARIDGVLKDLSVSIEKDCELEIIVLDSEDGLEIIRHDAAHIMAQAVQSLFPDVQVTIGPVIENGFYYDFAKSIPFIETDLELIERRMSEIIKANHPIIREVWTKDDAIDYFRSKGELYKIELIEAIPKGEQITLYRQDNFVDLCRGPHSPSTGYVKAFKLTKFSGSYWKGNSNGPALQRIYGTAWNSQEALDKYLKMIEEAQKRDHRKLGKDMDLFHFQEEAPGAVFWHPKGWKLFQTLVSYMRNKQDKAGYMEINTPEIIDKSLWQASGHWETFGHNMFTAQAAEDKIYAVKPMSCPGSIQVFNHDTVSYRDLPMRLSEFGKVHRYEASGALHGLMRVRAFTQDDAHIFCTEEQLQQESLNVCKLVFEVYKDFGFNDVIIKLSTRPDKRIGSDEIWDRSEQALLESLKELKVDFTISPGEGAFYGPKLEFTLRDAIGRDWQLGTLQVDFNLPERLGAKFTGSDGNKHVPVMLHRALFGSLERFIGILLEHHAGNLPIWLAPIKVALVTITSDINDYASRLSDILTEKKIDNILDLSSQTLSYKIKQHSSLKIPIILVIGKKEAETNSVTVRRLGSNENQTSMIFDQFLDLILSEYAIK